MALLRGQRTENARFTIHGRVLESTTSPNSGVWVRLGGVFPIAITIGGTASSVTWRVLVTNQIDQPTDNNHSPYGIDQTSKSPFIITVPFEWLNVVPVVVTGGTIFADVRAG